MKKVLLAVAFILSVGLTTASGPAKLCQNYPGYALEGPNHADFLKLLDRKPGLHNSLYNISGDMYYGPQTLSTLTMEYNRCNSL